VLVLIVCLVIVGVGLLLLGILGFGVYGQLSRLQRTVAAAQNELLPAVEALRPPAGPGRHRAG
jgi:hypothetical protein